MATRSRYAAEVIGRELCMFRVVQRGYKDDPCGETFVMRPDPMASKARTHARTVEIDPRGP
jgi:hypothetical protein